MSKTAAIISVTNKSNNEEGQQHSSVLMLVSRMRFQIRREFSHIKCFIYCRFSSKILLHFSKYIRYIIACLYIYIYIYIYICIVKKLVPIVEIDIKAPFDSYNTMLKVGVTLFPGSLHFTHHPSFIMLSVKQGVIKYHFLVFGMTLYIYIYIYICTKV